MLDSAWDIKTVSEWTSKPCRLRDHGAGAVGQQAVRVEALPAAAVGHAQHAAGDPVGRPLLGRAHGPQPGASRVPNFVFSATVPAFAWADRLRAVSFSAYTHAAHTGLQLQFFTCAEARVLRR